MRSWNDDERCTSELPPHLTVSDGMARRYDDYQSGTVTTILAAMWKEDIDRAIHAGRAVMTVDTEYDSGGEDAGDDLGDEGPIAGIRIRDMLRRAERRKYGAVKDRSDRGPAAHSRVQAALNKVPIAKSVDDDVERVIDERVIDDVA